MAAQEFRARDHKMKVKELITFLQTCEPEAELEVSPMEIRPLYVDDNKYIPAKRDIITVQVGPKRFPNLVFITFRW